MSKEDDRHENALLLGKMLLDAVPAVKFIFAAVVIPMVFMNSCDIEKDKTRIREVERRLEKLEECR